MQAGSKVRARLHTLGQLAEGLGLRLTELGELGIELLELAGELCGVLHRLHGEALPAFPPFFLGYQFRLMGQLFIYLLFIIIKL